MMDDDDVAKSINNNDVAKSINSASGGDGECECEVVVLQGVSPNMITPAANERTILQPFNRGLRFRFFASFEWT